jgi:hypothetical protein
VEAKRKPQEKLFRPQRLAMMNRQAQKIEWPIYLVAIVEGVRNG